MCVCVCFGCTWVILPYPTHPVSELIIRYASNFYFFLTSFLSVLHNDNLKSGDVAYSSGEDIRYTGLASLTSSAHDARSVSLLSRFPCNSVWYFCLLSNLTWLYYVPSTYVFLPISQFLRDLSWQVSGVLSTSCVCLCVSSLASISALWSSHELLSQPRLYRALYCHGFGKSWHMKRPHVA